MGDKLITYRDIQKAKFLDKLKKYCAYRERCHKEVIEKLRKLEADQEMSDEVISELIQENYLNEERYVQSYVRGKYRQNKWGRSKIIRELKFRNISTFLINKGLEEIIETEYLENLKQLILSKNNNLKAKNKFDRRQKLFQYVYRKGYESELISDILEDIL